MASDLKESTDPAPVGPSPISISPRSSSRKAGSKTLGTSLPTAAAAAPVAVAATAAAAPDSASGQSLPAALAAALKIGSHSLLILDSRVVANLSVSPGVYPLRWMKNGLIQPQIQSHTVELLQHMFPSSLYTTLEPEVCQGYEGYYAHSWGKLGDGTLLLDVRSEIGNTGQSPCKVPPTQQRLDLSADHASPKQPLPQAAAPTPPAQRAPKRALEQISAAIAHGMGAQQEPSPCRPDGAAKKRLERGAGQGSDRKTPTKPADAQKPSTAAVAKGPTAPADILPPVTEPVPKKPNTLPEVALAMPPTLTINQTSSQMGGGHGAVCGRYV